MKFKIDENFPAEIAADIRAAGHEADTVYDEQLAGAPDAEIMARVRDEHRAILTMDKGIADIRTYPPQQFFGIVLVRTGSTGRKAALGLLRRHLPELLQRDLAGRLVVITENGVRIRR